jgi:hypothetical protein
MVSMTNDKLKHNFNALGHKFNQSSSHIIVVPDCPVFPTNFCMYNKIHSVVKGLH